MGHQMTSILPGILSGLSSGLLSGMFRGPSPGLLLVGVLALAGCGTSSLHLSQDDGFYTGPALRSTARAFFQPAPGPNPNLAYPNPASGQNHGAMGPLVNINEDTLSDDNDAAYRRVQSYQLRARQRFSQPLGRGLALGAAVQLSQGHSRYELPQGAGVLVDPIAISFDTTALELSTGLGFEPRSRGRLGAQVELGVGGVLFHTRTRISSALLDVRHNATGRLGFGYASFGVTLAPRQGNAPTIALNSRVAYYPQGGVSVRSGLGLDF